MKDPTNIDRAIWAHKAIERFQALTKADNDDAVCDLLTDLMHFCDFRKRCNVKEFPSFEEELELARKNYQAELKLSRS